MARWLVTGAGGMLGRDLVTLLRRRGEDVIGLARTDLDVTNEADVAAALRRYRPAVVVNCAAWTAVDDAEAREADALMVNGRGAENVAAACAVSCTRMVHISTDYVFGGGARQPCGEGDPPAPCNAYGRTKLAGEQAVLGLLPCTGYVVRTAWLYGAYGPNFVLKMIRLARAGSTVNVVADQHGQPTWTFDVADQVVALGRSPAEAGIYHATSLGETTWFGLAQEVFRLLGADPARVRATSSDAYPTAARRPVYTVLGHDRHKAVGIEPIGDWRESLRTALPELIGT
jgi:dTDP-4-dehydrorhamnose reductase